MKINSKLVKPLLLAATAITLVVATVFATMAFMTSSAAVSNVFTVGNVKLHMFETKVNSQGQPVNAAGEVIQNYAPPTDGSMKTADTNSYNLVPGKNYLKDPTVYVDGGSEPSYLFVRVRNDLKTIEKQNDSTHPTIVQQLYANGWVEVSRDANNVDAVFVYIGTPPTDMEAPSLEDLKLPRNTDGSAAYYDLTDYTANNKVKTVGGVDSRVEYPVFNNFTLADSVPNLEIFGGARVAIVAYAIQADLPGFSGDKIGTKDAILHAWDYIKEELPFVV